MFVYKHIETKEFVKKLAYFLRKIQTFRVNDSRILTIKNAKLSGLLFLCESEYMGKFSNLH